MSPLLALPATVEIAGVELGTIGVIVLIIVLIVAPSQPSGPSGLRCSGSGRTNRRSMAPTRTEFGAPQLFYTDARLVFATLNHLRYQALRSTLGLSREQANVLTIVVLLGDRRRRVRDHATDHQNAPARLWRRRGDRRGRRA